MHLSTAIAWNDGTPSADLICTTTTVPADKTVNFFTSKNLFKSSSVVLVSTYCQSGISTLISESESTASGAYSL